MTNELERALTTGRGVERPFKCHEHPDNLASASVNSVTGLWFCHACGAKGKADLSEPPSPDLILDMLSLGTNIRTYPLTWLNLFDATEPTYWLERFPDHQVVKMFRLGVHPSMRYPTFPVFQGPGLNQLAGVGMRVGDIGTRYIYPSSFKASESFGLPVSPWAPHEVVVLVEGIADAVALAMSGITAWACWGAGIHKPQVELLDDLGVDHVIIGFDNDSAGSRATLQTKDALEVMMHPDVVHWPPGTKDPGELTPGDSVFELVLRATNRKMGDVLKRQREWWSGADCQG